MTPVTSYWKQWRSTLLYLAISLVITAILAYGALMLTGFGHGTWRPTEAIGGPFGAYIFAWPVLPTMANSDKHRLRQISQISVLVYYVWLLLHLSVVVDLWSMFVRNSWGLGIAFYFWLVLFASLHCLIWLPRIIKNIRSNRGITTV